MIYEFLISENKTAKVNVRANTVSEAQKIFQEWYDKHMSDSKDTLIKDMLDNGYEGLTITRLEGVPDSEFDPRDILLPEEKSEPEEPTYNMSVRFADGSDTMILKDIPLGEVGRHLLILSDKYYLFQDDNYSERALFNDPLGKNIWLYAVLKDKSETWHDLEVDVPLRYVL